MSIAGSHDAYYIIGDSQTLSPGSSGAAAATSTTLLGSQVRLVQLVGTGSTVGGTSGIRIKICAPDDSTVSSTVSALLPVNWVAVYKVNPGCRVAAIGNDATTNYTLVVTPLTD